MVWCMRKCQKDGPKTPELGWRHLLKRWFQVWLEFLLYKPRDSTGIIISSDIRYIYIYILWRGKLFQPPTVLVTPSFLLWFFRWSFWKKWTPLPLCPSCTFHVRSSMASTLATRWSTLSTGDFCLCLNQWNVMISWWVVFFYLNPTNIANIWCSADEQPHLLNIIGLQLYRGLNCLLITCCAFVCFRHLLLSECIHCPEPKVFSRFEELEQHMRKQHELFCCKLCTKHLKVKKNNCL